MSPSGLRVTSIYINKAGVRMYGMTDSITSILYRKGVKGVRSSCWDDCPRPGGDWVRRYAALALAACKDVVLVELRLL